MEAIRKYKRSEKTCSKGKMVQEGNPHEEKYLREMSKGEMVQEGKTEF